MYRRKYGDNVLDMILKHIKEIYPWMPRKYKKKQTEVTNIFSLDFYFIITIIIIIIIIIIISIIIIIIALIVTIIDILIFISDTVLLVGGEVDSYLHPAIANVEV